ncbi:MAG: lamin tail domain-containing protein [Saprospiraceae bacterium]
MKCKIYTLLFLIFFANLAKAQLVISEIMYNPPESGEDSLEYIEILNASSAPYNLQDVKFTAGVTFTFPSQILGAGQSVVVAKDSAAMKLIFGISTLQFTGALSNSGEGITLTDAQGNVLDELVYDDSAPWPLEPDEGGASLVLCDANVDNAVGSNWSAARNKTGIFINGKELLCSPGLANTISCSSVPSVFVDVMDFSFSPKDITIDVGTTVRWTNKGGTHNINGNQSVYPSNPASFGNGSPSSALWSYDFTFTKAGVYQYQCDPHASSGMKGTVTVGSVSSYPAYSISSVTHVNQEGVADSLNVKCQLTGIVHGYNLRPGGLQFTLIDNQNNGIGVFNGTNDLGYTVTEGDAVTIKGTINQFNGLTQIIADELTLKSSGNALVTPKSVQSLNEEDESSLVALQGAFNYVDPAEWKGDGSSFNVNITNGTQTILVRIDNDCSLSNQPAPSAPFTIKGIIGQFDSENPYDEGYQLFPRYAADFVPVSGTNESNTENIFSISPNPGSNYGYIKGLTANDRVSLYTLSGKLIQNIAGNDHLEASNLSNGLYLVEIKTKAKTQILKWVIAK